ncbi:MAG: SelT/SelW/SelH family protein [Calditrichales bacterium]|nr:MAG: SelT/SelW/SelH family protein [Calditrichales bacterium]
MADEIKLTHPEIEIEFIKSSGGVFEVIKDGVVLFSKKREGRFPDHREIIKQLSSGI